MQDVGTAVSGSNGTSGPFPLTCSPTPPLLSPAPRGGRETPVRAGHIFPDPSAATKSSHAARRLSHRPRSRVSTPAPVTGPGHLALQLASLAVRSRPLSTPGQEGLGGEEEPEQLCLWERWETPSLRPDPGTASHGLARTSFGAAGPAAGVRRAGLRASGRLHRLVRLTWYKGALEDKQG